jgi:hypothetical protein
MNTPNVHAGRLQRRVRLRLAKGEKFAYINIKGGGFGELEKIYKPFSELQISYDDGETWEPIPTVWVGKVEA